MGYLRTMYGKCSDVFVEGAMAAILEYSPRLGTGTRPVLKEIIEELAENPGVWDLEATLERGYPVKKIGNGRGLIARRRRGR